MLGGVFKRQRETPCHKEFFLVSMLSGLQFFIWIEWGKTCCCDKAYQPGKSPTSEVRLVFGADKTNLG